MNTVSRMRALVTGGANGIGAETAIHLAKTGMHVIIADKDSEQGKAVVQRILADNGSAEFSELELGDLRGIHSFASAIIAQSEPIDILINNAGLLPPKERATTNDGFELEFGIAYLGHFALTGLLLPALLKSKCPRVVSVSSLSHIYGCIDFNDLQLEHNYRSSTAYTSAKFACLMFAIELDRLAHTSKSSLISVAAHPGISKTNIAMGWKTEGRRTLSDRFELWSYQCLCKLFGQSATEGALPLVYAAAHPDIEPGGYYGPSGPFEMYGPPGPAMPCPKARNRAVAQRLWQVSEKLTGVRYRF